VANGLLAIRLHLVKDYALPSNSLLILQFLLRP
jgi:hypothetical protein